MSIEAPYKGREDAPQGQAPEAPADKPEAEVEANDEVTTYEADKPGQAPQEEEVAEAVTEEEETQEEEESLEVPDPNLILMRADYTRGKMALAEQRKAIEAREAELVNRYGVYEQVDALIAQNPNLAKTHTVEQLVALIQNQGAPAAASSLPPEVQRELASMRREVAETKESLFTDRVESSVKRIAKEYGLKRPQVEQLVKFAVEDEQIVPGMPVERINRRLVLIARGMTYKGAEAKGQTKLVKQLVEKGKAATGGTAASSTAAEASTPRVKGWDNLVKHYTAGKKSAG